MTEVRVNEMGLECPECAHTFRRVLTPAEAVALAAALLAAADTRLQPTDDFDVKGHG